MYGVTLGADPEIFLQNGKGKFISAIGKFGGTKENPKPFGKAGFFIQEDNVAVEFNTPIARSKDVFVRNIQYAVNEIEKTAANLGLKLAIVASAEFKGDQLRNPKAKRFGCDPDFNVWSLKDNPPPRPENKNLRSCGGHIHIGYTKDKIGIGRACDLFIGCPSIAFDDDRMRRLLYGKAGAIRDKPYGIEYRTPSNFWIRSKDLTEMVYQQVAQAVDFIEAGRVISNMDAVKIIQCINNSDKDLLRDLTKKFNLKY